MSNNTENNKINVIKNDIDAGGGDFGGKISISYLINNNIFIIIVICLLLLGGSYLYTKYKHNN